jgi:hypothetical protein
VNYPCKQHEHDQGEVLLRAVSLIARPPHRTQDPKGCEEGAHRLLHSAGKAYLEDELGHVGSNISDDVAVSPGHLNVIARPKRAFSASDPDGDRAADHLDSLILASVNVQGHGSVRVETDAGLEQRSISVFGPLQEGDVLASHGIPEITLGRHSCLLSLPIHVRVGVRRSGCAGG